MSPMLPATWASWCGMGIGNAHYKSDVADELDDDVVDEANNEVADELDDDVDEEEADESDEEEADESDESMDDGADLLHPPQLSLLLGLGHLEHEW